MKYNVPLKVRKRNLENANCFVASNDVRPFIEHSDNCGKLLLF